MKLTMIHQKYTYALIYLYLCTLLGVVSANKQQKACDRSKCKGPLKYYEDLRYIPIYGSKDNCCPIKYNCDNLKERSKNKCYFKGHEYTVGEKLREEDKKPCDIGCYCSEGQQNATASFVCAIVDCFQRTDPGCYLKSSFKQCCGGPQACPDKEPNLAKCVVDGQTYLDGQTFEPKSEPTLRCICGPGYKGKNKEPFCKPLKDINSCNVELRHADEIYNNCAPAFYSEQNPATDCNYFFRCQNDKDVILDSQGKVKPARTPILDPKSTCSFGNLTLNVGEKLKQATDSNSVCLECVCEIPPKPTCKQISDEKCDVTVHRNFDNSKK